MVLLFLLSLHIFMIAGYTVLIETHKSRMNYGYLLFALCIPFVGELCLIAADFGKSPASNDFVRPFKSFENAKKSNTCITSIDVEPEKINRVQLLEIIKIQPKNIVEILKNSLKSSDPEVVHIAASSIMKLQREYENNIKDASEKHSKMPNNMGILKNCIISIGDYYKQDLIGGEAAVSLLKQQEQLISDYLKVLPEDKMVGIISVENSIQQEKYEEAFNKAEYLRYLYISDIELWGLSSKVCIKAKYSNKLNEIAKEAKKMAPHWTLEQKSQWDDIQKGLGV